MSAVLFTALLGGLAFPPFPFFFLAWVMFFGWFRLLEKGRGGFGAGWLTGFFFHLITIHWIGYNSGLPPWAAWGTALLAIAYQAVWWGVLLAVLARISRMSTPRAARWVLPFLLLLLEWGLSFWDLAFPWTSVGYTQMRGYAAPGLFSAVGVFGASWWVGMLNAVLWEAIEHRFYRGWAVLLLVIPLLLQGINSRLVTPDPATCRVALLQTNLDPLVKWSAPADSILELNRRLLEQGMAAGAGLLMLPEAAVPLYFNRNPVKLGSLTRFAGEAEATVAVGGLALETGEKGVHRYNSVYFLAGNSPPQRYDKKQMVPFGERFPFQRWLPSLGSLNLGQAEFTPGTGPGVLKLAVLNLKVGCSICFEGNFPHWQRRWVEEGADLLLNFTNDGWYRYSGEPEQHFQVHRARAMETGKPLLRVGNTGVSAVVDGRGRITARASRNCEQVLTRDVHLWRGRTLYLRGGWLLVRTLALLTLLFLLGAWLRAVFKGGGILRTKGYFS